MQTDPERTVTLPAKLHPLNTHIVDGENNPITLDCAYALKGDALADTIAGIKHLHGPNTRLLPLSGTSGGAGVFQVDAPANSPIVGVHLSATPKPRIRHASAPDITCLSLDEIVIDEQQKHIYAGSAITLDQLNQALANALGAQFKVLGADLTSYTYAQVGATFMTGGMGPQRRYFSDSVREIALHDGEKTTRIQGASLDAYAGTYGWTGLVSAVKCEYIALPAVEIAFAIPVNNAPASLARLLQHFSPYAYLQCQDGDVLSHTGGRDLILGLEHITIASMQPFLRSGDNALTRHAVQLLHNCEAAGADGLIFVNGYSDLPADAFLLNLVDDTDTEEYTIAGINLEHTEIFNDPGQMRAVREGVPFAARTQAPQGAHVYKGHTDANIRLNPECVENTMRALWKANQHYVDSVQAFFAETAGLHGEILVYGHLNPVGVDPHNRITFACDDEALYVRTVEYIHKQRDQFLRTLHTLCEASGSVFIGGEKSAGSEYEMFAAFGGPDTAPRALAEKFTRQSTVIRAASPLFNWRAMTPYVEKL